MLRPIRGRITFSNVVALIALFVALGGTTYAAAKLSGKQIKPKSIPPNRIKPNSLSSQQIRDASLANVKSASALARVTYVSAVGTLDPAAITPLTVTATCPPKQKALGGGATVGDQNNSGAFGLAFTADRSGYLAQGSTFGGGPDTLTVTAACAPVTATTG
jgi:hypothetical protein